jgi:hypothetical protein
MLRAWRLWNFLLLLESLMGAIRNMNWTRVVPAFIVCGLPETDSQVTKIRLLIGEGVHSLLPTRGVAFGFWSGDPGIHSRGAASARQSGWRSAASCFSQRIQATVSSGLCELWWRNQNLVERSNQLELIKFGFEAQDRMAATWKVGTYLVSSLSAFIALLVGLFTLPVYPIVGALLVIGGMALELYAVAGLCGTAESKNESREESHWGEDRD